MTQNLSTAKYLEESGVNHLDGPTGSLDGAPPTQRWTTYLTVICALFLITSLIGAISAAYGFYGLSVEPEKVEVGRSAAAKKVAEIKQIQIDAKEKYFPVLVYLEVVKLGLSGAFIFAMVLLIARNHRARNFAIACCGMALFYHLCVLGMSILFISETGGVVNSMLDDMFSSLRFESAEQAKQVRDHIENRMISAVTIFIAIIFLVKMAFYGTIMAYLWTDDVKKIFGEDPLLYMKKQQEELDKLESSNVTPA